MTGVDRSKWPTWDWNPTAWFRSTGALPLDPTVSSSDPQCRQQLQTQKWIGKGRYGCEKSRQLKPTALWLGRVIGGNVSEDPEDP